MSTQTSVQYDKISSPQANGVCKPNELAGKVRFAYFELNTTSKAVASGDTINLTRLPKGARVVGGRVTYGAMGASATLSIGVAGTTNKYLNSADVSALGASDLANTQALNLGDALTAETDIIGTAGGANFAANKDIKGYLLYIAD